MQTEYLIVGNSAGGIGAIEAIRQLDPEGTITLVSDEPYPAYSRPLISEYLAGERDLTGILYRPEDFYDKARVRTMLGEKILEVLLRSNEAKLEGGEVISYRKMLLATGGSPIVPSMEGLAKKGVFTFTRLDDAKEIAKQIDKGAKKAVVIGGGLIGVSVTDALVKRGVEVVIVELMDRILGAVLDEEASFMAEEVIREKGVDIRTGHTVKTIVGRSEEVDSPVGGVILDNEDGISCDLVIIAIGVTPQVELVKGSDIKTNRGILVDRHMETSYPDVYACGDVAESYDFIYESDRVVPIWPNAHIGGRIAGYNMAGKDAEYPGGTAMNSLKYFELPISSAGMVNPANNENCEILSRKDNGRYQKYVLRGGRLVGMVMVRDIERAGIYFGLMRDGVDITGFKESLLSEEFGLINLPEDVLKRRLELPDLGRLHVFHEPDVYADVVDEG